MFVVGDQQNVFLKFKRLLIEQQDLFAGLRQAGVDGVSLANNHLFDYGREGFLRTMALLDQGGLPRTGGGVDRGRQRDRAPR